MSEKERERVWIKFGNYEYSYNEDTDVVEFRHVGNDFPDGAITKNCVSNRIKKKLNISGAKEEFFDFEAAEDISGQVWSEDKRQFEEVYGDEYWRRVDETVEPDIRLEWFRDYEKYFDNIADEILGDDYWKCIDTDPSRQACKMAKYILDEFNYVKLQRNIMLVSWILMALLALVLRIF